MLTLPDFRAKKIVFIGSTGDIPNTLKFRNSNIRLYKNDQFVNQVSCHIVFCVFVVGDFTLTSYLIRQAKERGISFFLLTYSLEVYAEIMSQAEGNYKLREIQYAASKEKSLKIAKALVINKIHNQMQLLVKNKLIKDQYFKSIKQVEKAESMKQLLGIEGNFTKIYFQSLFRDIGWRRRAPMTKEDIPNFLLDIGYTSLFNFTDALLNLFGFDTYKGFYHQLFFQRKSLSCDLMEPIRFIIDKALLKAYHLDQIKEKDFRYQNGKYMFKKYDLQKRYCTIFFEILMKYKEEIYTYVLEFYRYICDDKNKKMPEFKIRC